MNSKFLFFSLVLLLIVSSCQPEDMADVNIIPDPPLPLLTVQERIDLLGLEELEVYPIISVDGVNRGGTFRMDYTLVTDQTTGDTITNGQFWMGSNMWTFTFNPDGDGHKFRLNRNGENVEFWVKRQFYDYHFALGSDGDEIDNPTIIIGDPLIDDQLCNLDWYNPINDQLTSNNNRIGWFAPSERWSILSKACDKRAVTNSFTVEDGSGNVRTFEADPENEISIWAYKFMNQANDSIYYVDVVMRSEVSVALWERLIFEAADFTIDGDGGLEVSLFQTQSLKFHGYQRDNGTHVVSIPNVTFTNTVVTIQSNLPSLTDCTENWSATYPLNNSSITLDHNGVN